MKLAFAALLLSGCAVYTVRGASRAPASSATKDPHEVAWTRTVEPARQAVDRADTLPDPAARAGAYLRARRLALREWAGKESQGGVSSSRAERLQSSLSNLRHGLPRPVARVLWRTFIGHARAVEQTGNAVAAAIDLPLVGGADSCPGDLANQCRASLAELAKRLPNVVHGETIIPAVRLGDHNELFDFDWALHEFPKTYRESGNHMVIALVVHKIRHEGSTTVLRFDGKDQKNPPETECHRYLHVRADGVLQVQRRCEHWPAGKPLWSSNVVFRFDSPPIELHAGDRMLVVVDRAKSHATRGHHPTITFSSPILLSDRGSYGGSPPRSGWRYLYGVNVQEPLEAAKLGEDDL